MAVELCLCSHRVVDDAIIPSQSLHCLVEGTPQNSIIPTVSQFYGNMVLVFVGWDWRLFLIRGLDVVQKSGVFRGSPFWNDTDQFPVYDANDLEYFGVDEDVRCVEIVMVESK